MRGRIVFHDGTADKPLDVISVTDVPASIVVECDTYTLTYEKARVAFFQIVWHPDEER